MILIGLGAKACQGKNYVANYMKEAIPEIRFYSFADELKRHCKANHDELVGQWQLAHQTKAIPAAKDDPIYGVTAILQWFGTEVMRKHNPNYWVDCVASTIAKENPEVAVVTDVRFPNEAAWVKNHDGYLVEVIRLQEDGTRYYDPNRDKNHTSETALDDYQGWDYVLLCRSGDLNALRNKSLGILKNIIIDTKSRLDSVPDATGDSSV